MSVRRIQTTDGIFQSSDAERDENTSDKSAEDEESSTDANDDDDSDQEETTPLIDLNSTHDGSGDGHTSSFRVDDDDDNDDDNDDDDEDDDFLSGQTPTPRVIHFRSPATSLMSPAGSMISSTSPSSLLQPGSSAVNLSWGAHSFLQANVSFTEDLNMSDTHHHREVPPPSFLQQAMSSMRLNTAPNNDAEDQNRSAFSDWFKSKSSSTSQVSKKSSQIPLNKSQSAGSQQSVASKASTTNTTKKKTGGGGGGGDGNLAQIMEKWLKKIHGALKGGGGNMSPPKSITYSEVQVVQVRVVFHKLSDIDTGSGQFDGDVHVMARWQEPQFAGVEEEELDKIPFGKCWNPELTILNLQGQLECERAYYVIRYEADYVYPVVTFMWHVKGVFKENFELEHFPLDVQELSLVLSTNKPITEVELIEDYYRSSYLSPMALKDNDEWAPYSHVKITPDATSSGALSATSHSVLTCSCHARRLLGIYSINILLTLLVILVLSLVILAFDPTDVKRIDILMTLFLTTVAFKIVIQSTLPRLAYVTYLDLYACLCLVYLCVQGFVNAMWIHLSRYRSQTKIAYYDEVVQSVVIGCLVVFHAAFLVFVQFTALERRREMSRLDFEHKMGNRKKKIALQRTNNNAAADHSHNNDGYGDDNYGKYNDTDKRNVEVDTKKNNEKEKRRVNKKKRTK